MFFNTYVEVAELAKKHCTNLFRKSNIHIVKNSFLLTFLGCQCNNTIPPICTATKVNFSDITILLHN